MTTIFSSDTYAIPVLFLFLSIFLALASERIKYLDSDRDGSVLTILSVVCLGAGGAMGIRTIYANAVKGNTAAVADAAGGITRTFIFAVRILAASLIIRLYRNYRDR